MNEDSALVRNGLGESFYHACWNILGVNICRAVDGGPSRKNIGPFTKQ